MKSIKIVLLFLVIFMGEMKASEYNIKSVEELVNDISARTLSRMDGSNRPCAIVRICVPSIEKFQFGEMAVGEISYMPGEYLLYISPDTEELLFTDRKSDYSVQFADYDIEIEGKKSYRIILEKEGMNSSNDDVKTIIRGNYDNQVILLDGVPVGETPVKIEGLRPGKYKVSVPNVMGITMRDTVVDISGTSDNIINLNMYEEEFKPLYLEIAASGGDTAGWVPAFGVIQKEKKGKVGLEDYTGKILVPYEFDYVYEAIYPNGSYFVAKWDINGKRKCGLYKPNEGLIVPCEYNSIVYGDKDDRYQVSKDGKYGIIDGKGNIIIPIKYSYIEFDKNGFRVREKKEGYKEYSGLYDDKGNLLIDPYISLCENLGPYFDGYCVFSDIKGGGIINIKGEKKYLGNDLSVGRSWGGDDDPKLYSGLIRIFNKELSKWGYLSKDFATIIPFKYDKRESDPIANFIGEIALIDTDDDKILIDKKGREILSKRKQNLSELRVDGKFILYGDANNHKGIFNLDGELIIEPMKYNWLDTREDGEVVYFIGTDGDNGNHEEILDSNGNLLLSLPEGIRVGWIKDEIINVWDPESNISGYIDINGNLLANCISPISDNIDEHTEYYLAVLLGDYPISEGLAILNIGDRFGFIDKTGKVVVPLDYSAVTPFKNGVAYVREINGNWKKIFRDKL